MELLKELIFSVVSAAIAGAMIYFWRRSRIPALLILAAGLALLALPIAIVVSRAWYMSSEGSPAGTIWFVLVLSFGLMAAIAGAMLAMTGMMRVLEGVESVAARFLASLVAVVALVVAEFSGYRAWKGPTAPKAAAAPRVEYTEPHRGGKAGAKQAADRQRYDECVAYMRESYRPETLKTCADELLAAWDESHAAKARFANMPDDGSFAGSIGALYVAYAEATQDHRGALAGVRRVHDRTLARHPRSPALERLESQAADLEKAVGLR